MTNLAAPQVLLRQPLLFFLIASVLTLPACAQEKAPAEKVADARLPEPTQARIDSLAEATREGLVFVEGGTFVMGDQKTRYIVAATGAIDSTRGEQRKLYWTNDSDNCPPYEARLTGYSIQAKEVDYRAYDLFTQATEHEPASPHLLGEKRRGPRYPAGTPNWQSARDYCRWIGEQAGVEMDLPTEAQWEYAARGRGRNVAVSTNTDTVAISRDAGERVPYRKQAPPGRGNVAYGEVQPVGSFPSNPLGLHDMTSNVGEWVLDWYDEDYYAKMKEREGIETDPQGPESGEKKIMRGGRISYSMTGNNNFSRDEMPATGRGEYGVYYEGNPDKNYSENGFRCVANRDEPIE